MKTITVLEFMKAIKENVCSIEIITADNRVIRAYRDDDADFKQQLIKAVLNKPADEYEINYSSKTETLRLFTQMSLQQIDRAFDVTTMKGGAE